MIIIVAILAYWLFKLILVRLEKRDKIRSEIFFKGIKKLFPLTRKGGNYCILLLLFISIANLVNFPMTEKNFYTIMILLIASLFNSLLKGLLPYLEQIITIKTKTKIDDAAFVTAQIISVDGEASKY